MQHIPNSDWRVIPEFPDYAVTPDGQVWSFKSNKFLKLIENKQKYLRVMLSNGLKRKNCKVHRLVGKAFIPLPPEFNGNYDIATINHKDHNKANNHYLNLEWVTREYNAQEAWTSGWLDHKKRPCFIIDVKDKSRKNFGSVSEAKRKLQKVLGEKAGAFDNKSGVLYGRYIVGYLDDPAWKKKLKSMSIDEIIESYADKIRNHNSTLPKPCFCIDIKNRKRTNFKSTAEADKHYKLPSGAVSGAIYNKSNGLLYGSYIFGFLDSPYWKDNLKKLTIDEIIGLYADKIAGYKRPGSKPCFVIDIENRKRTNFKSTAEADESLKVAKDSVSAAINKRRGLLHNKYIVGYLDDPMWKEDFSTYSLDMIIKMFTTRIENESRACFCIDSENKGYRVFNFPMEVDKHYGFVPGSAGRVINNQDNLLFGRFIIGLLNDSKFKDLLAKDEIDKIIELYSDKISKYIPRSMTSIKVTDLKTNESKKYKSLSEFARDKGVDPKKASQYIKKWSDLYKVERL